MQNVIPGPSAIVDSQWIADAVQTTEGEACKSSESSQRPQVYYNIIG